jgi:hypothetical protein
MCDANRLHNHVPNLQNLSRSSTHALRRVPGEKPSRPLHLYPGPPDGKAPLPPADASG